MGGSKIQTVQPEAPPAPSTADAIREFVRLQPELFRLQQEQAPQEAALQVELAQQFAGPLGQALRDAQRGINPDLTALQDQLSQQALANMNQGLPDELKAEYADTFKSLVGNQVNSGIGADFISKQLLNTDLAFRENNFNKALSVGGFQQVAQPYAPTTNNFSGSFQPGQVLGYNQGIYGQQANYSRPQYFQQPGLTDQLSKILGGVGGAAVGLSML